ncbi:MAG: threonylcarbamoyl-AMP synthase [Bacteroidales bacterium]|nr:threonylcarbamoyl-AMP synthase [Bacteroidales bacterium]
MARCELIALHPQHPAPQHLAHVAEVLRGGGVVAYPTDSVYGLGCDIASPKAVERIMRIKGIKPKDAKFSLICCSIAQAAQFAKIDNTAFRLMKRTLPGPFTYLLPGLHHVPDHLMGRRRTLGVRIPSSPIALGIQEHLGRPLLNTSAKSTDGLQVYPAEPTEIFERYQNLLDLVIDGGLGGTVPSTVVDCTGREPTITRQGLGEL